MKPKFKQNLQQLTDYYYAECNDYQVKIYIDKELQFDDNMQLVEFFGHNYLNVVEFYRNPSAKTITIYTSEHEYIENS